MLGEISALGSALTVAASAVISKSLTGKIGAMPIQTARSWFGSVFLIAVLFMVGRADELAHMPLLPIGMTLGSAFIGIAAGDSLSSLARWLLGDAKLWPGILQLNRDVVSDPNGLLPGTVLKIPQPPANPD